MWENLCFFLDSSSSFIRSLQTFIADSSFRTFWPASTCAVEVKSKISSPLKVCCFLDLSSRETLRYIAK